MQAKLLLSAILLSCSGCLVSPQFLPKHTDIDVSPYGSYIKINPGRRVPVRRAPQPPGFSTPEPGPRRSRFLPLDSAEKRKGSIFGELIAIDSTQIFVLDERDGRCRIVPADSVRNFKLRYARAPQYGWSIPASAGASLMGGALAILLAPVNLAVTISVTSSANRAYQYNNNTISYKDLQLFARFPQGVPEGVKLEDLAVDSSFFYHARSKDRQEAGPRQPKFFFEK